MAAPVLSCRSCCLVARSHILARLGAINGPKLVQSMCTEVPEKYTKYTRYVESKEEFKYVRKLMAPRVVQEPPEHASYPTPSGWFPPDENRTETRYVINRTPSHMFPVYFKQKNTNRNLTIIRRIEGDIWALEADIRTFIEELRKKKLYTRVHEVTQTITLRGIHLEDVAAFMKMKGF